MLDPPDGPGVEGPGVEEPVGPVTPVVERVNPVHVFAGSAVAWAGRLVSSPGWAMSRVEQAETLLELDRLASQVTELAMRVAAAASREGLGSESGHVSTASWLAARTRRTRAAAQALVRVGLVLDEPGLEPLRVAFAVGRVNAEQVRVIVAAWQDLAVEEVSDEERARAVAHLLVLAGDHDAKALRRLAKRLFEVIAPDEADRREEAALRREEQRARRRTRLSMRDQHDGTTTGSFTVPTATAEAWLKVLQAFVAPRRSDPARWRDETGQKVSYARLLGQALCDLVEHLPVDRLPQAGGVAATVVVTMDLAALQAGVGAGTLDTGAPVSAGQVRRLACNAQLVPAVLGATSVPLDLGRASRLYTAAQRTAMAVRDQGCTAEGCDRPPAWCEAHHDQPWSHGGPTDLATGRLLCPFHHRLAHHDGYRHTILPNGNLRFTRTA